MMVSEVFYLLIPFLNINKQELRKQKEVKKIFCHYSNYSLENTNSCSKMFWSMKYPLGL